MNPGTIVLMAGFLACIYCTAAFADPWKSELEVNTDFIQSMSGNPDINLNKILRGMSGLELNIYFRSDSAELDYQARQQIANVARIMWVYPMVSASLGFHTDIRGAAEYNRKLAQKRLDAVHNLLRDLLSSNYHSRRFNTHAYGESYSPHHQHDIEGMSFDRRVSILLLVPVK